MTSTSAIATGHANREIALDVRRGSFLASLDRTALARPPWCARSRPSCCLRLGEIRVFNRDAFFEPMVVKALLVIIPQEASLYWNLSVWQHLRIFGKLHGLTKGDAHRRANELIDILHLEEPRDKTPAALSGGLRRRVFVGIATLTRPPVMVTSPPSVLPPSRAAICGLTSSLSREGVCDYPLAKALHSGRGNPLRSRWCHPPRTTHRTRHHPQSPNRPRPAVQGHLPATGRIGRNRNNLRIYGDDYGELAERVGAQGIREYSTSKANLEDVFLALTGEREAFE